MNNSFGDLSEVIERINVITESEEYAMDFNPPVPTSKITDFEETNNLTIPKHYKEFLSFTDGCCLCSATVQLYGICHIPYIKTDFSKAGVDDGYYTIGTLGWGEPICFQNGSEKIIQYGETLIEYTNFKTFLEYIIFEVVEFN